MESQIYNAGKIWAWMFQRYPVLPSWDDVVVDNKAMGRTKFYRKGEIIFLIGFPDDEILIKNSKSL